MVFSFDIIAACTTGTFCNGVTFDPYNYYRIIEGEVAPYQVGYFRMNYGVPPAALIDPYIGSVCPAANQVLLSLR